MLNRLFVGTQRPARLFVINTADGSVVAKHTIMGDCNGVHYDSANRRLYATCGAGTIEVFEQETGDEFRLVDRIATCTGARTSCFSMARAQLPVPMPVTRDQPAELRLYDTVPREQPSEIPNRTTRPSGAPQNANPPSPSSGIEAVGDI